VAVAQFESLSQHVPDCSYCPSAVSHAWWHSAAVLAFCQHGPEGPYAESAGPSAVGSALARHASRSAQVESGEAPVVAPSAVALPSVDACPPSPVACPPSEEPPPLHQATACSVADVQSAQLAQENTVPSEARKVHAVAPPLVQAEYDPAP
jgi:hypothetical protein